MEKSNNTSQSREVFIVDGARTPFLKFKGVPGDFSASDLAVGAARPLLARQPFDAADFDQVIVGCVGPSEEEANIARIISLRLGCGDSVPAFTVQRNCASGLQSIDTAAQSIANGQCNLVLAGGTEAMSRAPLLYSRRMATWLGHFQKAKSVPKKLQAVAKFRPNMLVPVIALLKGLTDPVVNMNMGQTAEELAYQFGISREQADEYAMNSHLRAAKAYEQHALDEVTPLYSNKGDVYQQDDGVRPDSTMEKLAKLKPVFEKYGKVTPGNSSQISDGAAFVILASKEAVSRYNLPVLGKIKQVQWAALSPAIMGLGPVHAMSPILQHHNLSLADIDFIEINEAFAAQVLACREAWNDDAFCKEALGLDGKVGLIDLEKLNPDGGAIAMGHPVGASGTRLVLHILNKLHKTGGKRALASLCIGGGQGGAILLEKV